METKKPIFILKDPCIEYLENVKKTDIGPVKSLLRKIAIQTYKYYVKNNKNL